MICSTIIATMNRPSLERAVNSAIEQGLGPDRHEIIVVNDSGNPLASADWLDLSNVRSVNTNRCERSVARNVGAAVAHGKYLHFLDDDDYLAPNGLLALLDVAERTACPWVYGANNRVDDEDMIISLNQPAIEGNILALLVAGEGLSLGPSLIRRDAFLKVGGFDPQLRALEDRDLQIRIALIGDFDYSDQLVLNMRIGVGGVSTTDWSGVRKESRIVREKALSSPGALSRILDSAQGDPHLRGYCSRTILKSAVANLFEGRFFVSTSRILQLLRLVSYYPISPDFWRGLRFHSEWHTRDKRLVEQHYASMNEAEKIESAI